VITSNSSLGRFFGATVVVVVLAQFLAVTVLALALGPSFQSGLTFVGPVAVLVVPALYFGYRREQLAVLVVSNPFLVVYSQFLLGHVHGGPGGIVGYVVAVVAFGLAVTIGPFALAAAVAIGLERTGGVEGTDRLE
jgi:hypothetical protein